METTKTVTVLGPNLPSPLQNQGTFHVHAAGCAHLNKSPLRQVSKWERCDLTVQSMSDVIQDVYEDIIAERLAEDPESTYGQEVIDLASEFHFAPCANLPFGGES